MSEKYRYQHDNVGWLLAEAVGGLIPESKVAFWKATSDLVDGEMEIELKVNGVEVPFTRTMKTLDENLERLVESRAKEMLEEKASELKDKMRQLDEAIDRLFPGVDSGN